MTDVNKLIELEPFADSTIDALESIVSKQLSGEVPYSFEVNKLLMKNYQVKPVRANVNFIGNSNLFNCMNSIFPKCHIYQLLFYYFASFKLTSLHFTSLRLSTHPSIL